LRRLFVPLGRTVRSTLRVVSPSVVLHQGEAFVVIVVLLCYKIFEPTGVPR
jgi:hypothetical protein